MNFINCLRCKHYAVTAEDLYKLFSLRAGRTLAHG